MNDESNKLAEKRFEESLVLIIKNRALSNLNKGNSND